MNKEGIDTSIVSFSLQYPSALFPGSSQLEKSLPNNIVNKLKIYQLINSINPFSWFKTAKFIAAENPDLLIVRYWLPFFSPALSTIIRRVKRSKSRTLVIAITDNVLPHEKRVGDKTLTKYFLKSCDAFIVMSGSVMSELKAFIKSPNVKLIHHPVYDIFGESVDKRTAREKLKLDQNKRYVMFFGFIRKYKGLDLLLEAMADPGVARLHINLIIAGEYYDDRKYYDDVINGKELSDRVINFDHYIPSEDVKYFFAAADLIAQPYRSASQSGITQLAYHFERPVLVTNVGGLPEVISADKSGYVTNIDAKEIAEKIVDYYSNDREAGMVKALRGNKSNFSWKSMIDGITEIYQDAVTA
jgi:glycosyltransferase involved in cell wall biosynthesis